MKNTIRAQANFSFKGEAYELDTVIDLDCCSGNSDEMPNFHRYLAREANIDTYSYLYEVLESYDIKFSDATGLAAQYCHDGYFDWFEFEKARREECDWDRVRSIAQSTLGSRDLDADPLLKSALLAVFNAGKTSAH